jgi:hypothetical protein
MMSVSHGCRDLPLRQKGERIIMKLIMARHIVEQTASMFDQIMPGWEARIDRDTLDISSAEKCVVGQLFPAAPSFMEGMVALRSLLADSRILISLTSSVKLGLTGGYHRRARFADLDIGDVAWDDDDEVYLYCEVLTLAWQQLIDDRALTNA